MEKLQQFFTNDWAVRRQGLESVLTLLAPCIMSGNLDAAEALLASKQPVAKALSAPYLADWHELDDAHLPVNSIAMVYLTGMLYAWETDWLIRTILAAEANPNIAGIVMVIDGPGGHITRLDVAADAITSCIKPVATVVAGDMHSAHFWLGTCADRTFALSQFCSVGSVGAMCEYMSIKELLVKLGIEVRDIYPDTSDLKNQESRALEAGDDTLTKARLETAHRVFAETVARNLGIEYDPKLELFRGRVYSAPEAVAAGYIDQMGTVHDAVVWVLGRAVATETSQLYR